MYGIGEISFALGNGGVLTLEPQYQTDSQVPETPINSFPPELALAAVESLLTPRKKRLFEECLGCNVDLERDVLYQRWRSLSLQIKEDKASTSIVPVLASPVPVSDPLTTPQSSAWIGRHSARSCYATDHQKAKNVSYDFDEWGCNKRTWRKRKGQEIELGWEKETSEAKRIENIQKLIDQAEKKNSAWIGRHSARSCYATDHQKAKNVSYDFDEWGCNKRTRRKRKGQEIERGGDKQTSEA